MLKLNEDSIIEYKKDSDLSYFDNDNKNKNVLLMVKEKPIGKTKVFLDREENNREYITVNNIIVYLDTLKKENKL